MSEHPLHYRAVEMNEADGALIKRLFPVAGLRHVDPFVLLDEFFLPPAAGVSNHHHRGFESITYLLAGGLHHSDDLGNDAIVAAGGAQTFTAGRGLSHTTAAADGSTAHGIRLWVNTAKIHKDLPPTCQQVEAGQLPVQNLSCGRVCTIVGPGSPIHLHTAMSYHDVQLEHEGEFHVAIPAHHMGLLYALSGQPEVAGERLPAGEALALAGGSVLTVYAERPCRFICLGGQPHGEPILQHGTILD